VENVERDTFDIPGIGEFKARRGTSTAELAGAAAFWHQKSKSAWRDGFLSACVVLGLAGITAGAAIHLWF
jgi:hypothetical protein